MLLSHAHSLSASFPRSGDVFAVTFEHEGMLGLHCLKAVEEGRDMIRDIIPVFAVSMRRRSTA